MLIMRQGTDCGDVLDYHMDVSHSLWGNELLGECLCSLSAFLVLLLFHCRKL